ncbi:tetratricopeptide repeat protein 38-like isoform X2 [Haliotis asinina]|uniref:tetratricopeptide repeat protein 38-like isoform X2 n=1 Tax=Haliotis asinina TaxID=109174 RepID=UPI0035321DE7
MHSQWRDCQEWKSLGLPLSTSNNEASKMFDATLTQYVGWYDDTSIGGIETSLQKMMDADPNFVMGHVLKNGLDLMGTGRNVTVDQTFLGEINEMLRLAETSSIEREKQHARALKLWSDGLTPEACNVWEDILLQNPLDILALKFAHDSYFYLGYPNQNRDSIARVLPKWNPGMPLYGYLVGMYSFGLEECSLYDQAERTAKQGLNLNPRDAWSTHTLCHVMEMTGRQDEGISFLTDTVANWASCGMLACHNYWHWALYYIEKGDYQGALNIFDTQVTVRSCKSGALLDLVDACSLLFRLEMEGVDVGERWNDIYDVCRPHVDDHILAFNDVHILMACLASKQPDAAKQMMESIKQFVQNGRGTNQVVTEEVGLTLCEAFVAYKDDDFAKAVDLLKPIRYNIIKIGGSHAQRDIFNLFLIQAAIKSPSTEHHKLARSLLMERKALKENAPMTDRLIAKAMAVHAD